MGGNSGRKVMPARSGSLGGRRATTFAYAEYDGDVYRWPIDGASGKLTESGYINMVRWRYGAWEEVAYGTDIRAKVIHRGMKLTPEAVVAETGTKDALA